MSIRSSQLLDHPPPNATFAGRLRWLIGTRQVNAWFAALQISDGTRARMLKGGGIPPTYDALVRIMRTENVSLSWLLGADVAPFLRATAGSDEEAAELLNAHLSEERWQVDLLTDCVRDVWLLHQPAALVHERGDICYRALQVIAGPSGPMSVDALKRHALESHCRIRYASSALMRAASAGMLGTWRLYGDAITPGLLDSKDYRVLELFRHPDTHRDRVRETAGTYVATPPPAKSIIDAWPHLSPARKQALGLVVDGLVNPPPGAPE